LTECQKYAGTKLQDVRQYEEKQTAGIKLQNVCQYEGKKQRIKCSLYILGTCFSGRGRGEGYLQRGLSAEEGGGFGRPPSHSRSDGWEEV
jgi:hypothetical protein